MIAVDLRRLVWVVRFASAASVIARMLAMTRARPRVEIDGPTSSATISVVIPARNEEQRLEPLLVALAGAEVAEVIVVDDCSTDATVRLAERFDVTVISGTPLPDGWCGKPWALQQGVESAHGDWIIALDADTRPHPELARALVARSERDGLSLLTVAGRFDTTNARARALQASMLTTLIYRYGAPGTGRVGGSRQLANGQCLAIRRDHLDAVGGFGVVRGSTEEDVALARVCGAAGYRTDFLDAGDLLLVEGYESFGATLSGWGRSIAIPSVERRSRRLVDGVIVLICLPLPLCRIVSGRADRLDLLLLGLRWGTMVGARRAFVDRGAGYWLSPLLDGVAWFAQVSSGLRSRQRWRGRVYVRPARRARTGTRQTSSARR